MEIFSGGGSGTCNIMHLVPHFTDIQVGSYLFMESHLAQAAEWAVASVTNAPARVRDRVENGRVDILVC